ncbi:hypothetical protein A2Z33_02540 [Candidatus Gottesmanbacteria bacterium RBG_16_52_11]|uniref:Uncharacterized protein n=1 Tax=Candidatus Gottesmanbacteria bacterium RBG_16_52_11 TaxID=1798374 RepID=A0A1F5YMM3_9BACT|nr:MAG: hypothetical protein A2Z33_02540 [Candidatus Gottesmanbacteria bacterium RBG_16_52_11]
MGSFVEINDTLRISRVQGFPEVLDYKIHFRKPFTASDFKGKVFEFKNKPNIRLYKAPPVRNFFVEDVNGKWLYWGLVLITEVTLDYVNKTTSGKFEIIYINTPEEMKTAHRLIDRNPETDFFR